MAVSAETLASYANYRYNFRKSPYSEEILSGEEINCQTFVHKFYKDEFGIQLGRGMWSKEIVEDNSLIFRDIDVGKEEVCFGDIVAFVPKDIPQEVADDPTKAYHLTIFVGRSKLGEGEFMHANYTDNTVSIWTLDQFSDKYEGIGAVKRVQEEWDRYFVRPITARQEEKLAV